MITPIRENDVAKKANEELRQQLAVTEAVLLKVLQKVGTTTITAEDLAAPVGDNVVIDMDFDEQADLWTFSLKDEVSQEA